MRRWISGIALFAALAAPAYAKDIVLPAKVPAVTATLPDDWDTSVYETEIASVSADGDIVFNIAADARSQLETLIKDSKAYLAKSKVKLVGKPAERTIDYNGTPGLVQRYQATDTNGKTIVDFVTLEASRNRAVLLTVWGSQGDRETNEDALTAIMKSVKIPAGTGGGGFWSGAPAQPGKVEATKQEAAKPEAPTSEVAKPEAPKSEPPKAAAAPGPAARQALGVRRAVFVNRASAAFGDADARASDAFLPSEKLVTYMEPVGETLLSEGDTVRFGLVIDYEIRNRSGGILTGQKAVLDKELRVPASSLEGGNPRFYLDMTLGIASVDPGAYVLAYTLRDKFSDRTAVVEQLFTVLTPPAVAVATPAPADAATGSGLCTQVSVRKDLMDSVNGAPDYKDGKRRLKDLADPETLLEDRKAKLMTCRYTSVWAETQDSGVSERRMKMTFKMSDDGKDGVDIDYSFDK